MKFNVNFDINADSILRVCATDIKSGKVVGIIVKSNTLSTEEIAKME